MYIAISELTKFTERTSIYNTSKQFSWNTNKINIRPTQSTPIRKAEQNPHFQVHWSYHNIPNIHRTNLTITESNKMRIKQISLEQNPGATEKTERIRIDMKRSTSTAKFGEKENLPRWRTTPVYPTQVYGDLKRSKTRGKWEYFKANQDLGRRGKGCFTYTQMGKKDHSRVGSKGRRVGVSFLAERMEFSSSHSEIWIWKSHQASFKASNWHRSLLFKGRDTVHSPPVSPRILWIFISD